MMKRFFPLLFILAACGSGEKTPFCKCMEAGNELNEYSAKMLESVEIEKADEIKMNELKETEEKLCKEYKTMSGEKMLKLKRECTEMNKKESALMSDEKGD